MYSERELCVYLINIKKYPDTSVLLNFFTLINDLSFKTKDTIFLHIKLKWYMDAINFNDEEKVGVKEVDELRFIIKKYNLDKQDFINLLNAKMVDLDTFPFKKYDDIVQYIDNTEFIITKNIAIIIGVNEVEIEKLKPIARAYGLMGIVRNSVFFYKSKNIYTLFYNYDEALNDFENTLKNKAKEYINKAKKYLQESKSIKYSSMASKKFLVFNTVTQNYIVNIKKADYHLFQSDLHNLSKLYYLKLFVRFINII